MPITRHVFDRASGRTVEAPYYVELLMDKENGRLSRDPEAHALWHYFGIASIAYKKYKENIVYEDEPSHEFKARDLFVAVSRMYAVSPEKMVRYWDQVIRQRMALGLCSDEDLPEQYRFRFWSH